MLVALVLFASLGLAALAYRRGEGLGRRAVLPAGLRFIACATIGLLVANASCERPARLLRPLVLLDASLSMGAGDGAVWRAARAEAGALGEVRLIGPVEPSDTTPAGGRSVVAPAVLAAVSTGRPVWLVSDGEIEDGADLPPDVVGRIGVKVLPRAPTPDLALTRLIAPDRIAVGDTLRIEVEVAGHGLDDRRQVTIEVRNGATRLLSASVPLARSTGRARVEGVPVGLAPGAHVLDVALADTRDAEPRTDVRLAVLTVTPTPGIVVVASPAGWESRFLFRALEDVAGLPVRGYVGLPGGEWRRLGDLAPVSAAAVEQAAARADVLALVGDPPDGIRRAAVRGRWTWPATSERLGPTAGDWYLAPGGGSPLAGAFVGLPVDSFPPGVAMVPLSPGPADWVGLTAQLNRRGAERPAVTGRDSAGRREVIVAVAGLWRWAFRGGASEQAYRAWVAATVSWLLAGTDSISGRARPVRLVAQRGRPLVFQRARVDSTPLPIELRGPQGRIVDTLRFDGAGRAEILLPPGAYRYRLAGGGEGLVAVEGYSDEWLARSVTLSARSPTSSAPPSRAPFRDQRWLFALAGLALLGEWWWRRRAGLR